MDERYALAGITLSVVPELDTTHLRPGSEVGTLGGGILRWVGGTQSRRTLHGTGLTDAERIALLAALTDGDPVDLDDGTGTISVVVITLHTEPELGTDRYRFRAELLATG